MAVRLEFKEVIRVDGYGLIIHFNDGTQAAYTVDEMANMRPVRNVSIDLGRPGPEPD